MPIFVTDISAFRLWFCDQPVIRAPRLLTHVPEFQNATARTSDLPREQLNGLNMFGKLHLAVATRQHAHCSCDVAAHVITNPAPGTFIRLSPDVYATSPAATLVQLAPRLPIGSLAALFNQLLGTFCIRNNQLVERRPLMTRGELESYVSGVSRTHGIKTVRKLLPYVLENTASPTEARVAALLLLPSQWGGYGLPLPRANYPIRTDDTEAARVRYADYCWNPERLVLEYDSDTHHAGVEKLSLDSARRAELQAAGYTVVTLTNHQLHNATEFDNVIQALHQQLGVSGRSNRDADDVRRTEKLRKELFDIDPLQHLERH